MTALKKLGTLEAGGLIQIAALQPELEYLFRHALVQEAAYASLLKQDRKALHRAAADTILALHPGRERELAGVAAMHLEEAGDSGRAAEFYVLAGEHGLERFANREAFKFFSRALELAPESRPDVRLRAAVGAATSGWPFTAEHVLLQQLEGAIGAAGTDQRDLVTEACFWVAFIRGMRGETPEASPELKAALERAAAAGGELRNPAAAAVPRALMGAFAAFAGQLRQGATEMREALDVIEKKGDAVSAAMVSNFLTMAYSRLGDFASAEEILRRSEGYAKNGDAIALVDLDIALAGYHLERGEPDRARASAQQCSTRAEELGAYACVVASNLMFGAASLARQDAAGAKGALERGSELCRVVNFAPLRTMTYALLGSARADLGDLPGGIAGWNEALEAARAMNDRFGEAHTLWGRGRSYAHQPNADLGAALTDLERAVELFESIEARPSLARALESRSEILRGLGRADDAARDASRCTELGRELGLLDLASS